MSSIQECKWNPLCSCRVLGDRFTNRVDLHWLRKAVWTLVLLVFSKIFLWPNRYLGGVPWPPPASGGLVPPTTTLSAATFECLTSSGLVFGVFVVKRRILKPSSEVLWSDPRIVYDMIDLRSQSLVGRWNFSQWTANEDDAMAKTTRQSASLEGRK